MGDTYHHDFSRRLDQMTSEAEAAIESSVDAWFLELVARISLELGIEDKLARKRIALSLLPMALAEIYELNPPEIAVRKAGLVEGDGGRLSLPNGACLGISGEDLFGSIRMAAKLAEILAPAGDPTSVVFLIDHIVRGVCKERWEIDYDQGPETGVRIFEVSHESAAAAALAVNVAVEVASPEEIALSLVAGGAYARFSADDDDRSA